jgi:hypothetical protein
MERFDDRREVLHRVEWRGKVGFASDARFDVCTSSRSGKQMKIKGDNISPTDTSGNPDQRTFVLHSKCRCS